MRSFGQNQQYAMRINIENQPWQSINRDGSILKQTRVMIPTNANDQRCTRNGPGVPANERGPAIPSRGNRTLFQSIIEAGK